MKGVLWRVAKRLSYIEDARCLKVKGKSLSLTLPNRIFFWFKHSYEEEVEENRAWVLSVFHRCANEISALLGCYAV